MNGAIVHGYAIGKNQQFIRHILKLIFFSILCLETQEKNLKKKLRNDLILNFKRYHLYPWIKETLAKEILIFEDNKYWSHLLSYALTAQKKNPLKIPDPPIVWYDKCEI